MRQREVGKLVKEIRQEKGLTQTELAKRLGVTPQFISRVEQGLDQFPTSKAKLLCKKLKESKTFFADAYLVDFTNTVLKSLGI
jgi:transcriptional regulator with XRE-family HTH domain